MIRKLRKNIALNSLLQTTIATTAADQLRRSFQCALVVSHEFLDAFGSEFVSEVKALPWKAQIQVFVRERFQGFALRVDRFVREILVRHGKTCCCPFL